MILLARKLRQAGALRVKTKDYIEVKVKDKDPKGACSGGCLVVNRGGSQRPINP